MKSARLPICAAVVVLASTSAFAQGVTLRAFTGFLKPSLSDVNNVVESQIGGWSEIIGESIATPDRFNGDQTYGGQVNIRLDETWALNINISYFNERNSVEHLGAIETPALQNRFYFDRNIKLYDFWVGMNHYFDYSVREPLNYYVGFAAGLSYVKAKSTTELTYTVDADGDSLTFSDAFGDFSGSTLAGTFYAGAEYRVLSPFIVWGEFGVDYINFGRISGTFSNIDRPNPIEEQTVSTFNFTGYYLRLGLGLILPTRR
jgi:opacity protein-like surface antigen